MNLPFYDDHFGKCPILKGRGVIGASTVNIYALIQNINWDIVFLTAHELDITSSSNDDAFAGTGTNKIVIYGLDNDFNPLAEEVTMSGQTAVTTLNKFRRVFAAYATINGLGSVNAGDIYIVKTGTSTWTAGVPDTLTSGCIKMLVGDNLGYSGLWTVPRGRQFHLENMIPVGNKAASLEVRVGYPAENVNRGPYSIYKVDVGTGVGSVGGAPDIYLPEKTDVYCKGIALAASTIVSMLLKFKEV